MPVILTDLGKPESLPVIFEDGPLFDNTTYTINPNKIDLREEVVAQHQGDDHIYKVVGMTPVLLDFLRTE